MLDREQTGANAEFVKAEFEKAARELQSDFGENARAVTESLTQELERRFSDGSSDAVQHRIRELVGGDDDAARARTWPAASRPRTRATRWPGFSRPRWPRCKRSAEQQDAHLRAMRDRIAELQQELEGLRGDSDKHAELALERERGTAKGRDYEETVGEALDAIAAIQGDDCDAVGDVKGTTRKTGDIVVAIEAARGPARGRIVFEAKNSRLSKPEAHARAGPRPGRAGGRLRRAGRALGGQAARPHAGAARIQRRQAARGLRRGGGLVARARAGLPARPGARADGARRRRRRRLAAVAETVERALGAMDDVRSIKQKLTGARTSIDAADELLETMAAAVRAHLARIDELLAGAGD